MIENLKIITGTPAEVAKQAQAYLDSHPKAQVLSSAVTVAFEPQFIEPTLEVTAAPATEAAAPAAEPKTAAEKKAAAQAAAKKAEEAAKPKPPKAITTVSLTLGRVL